MTIKLPRLTSAPIVGQNGTAAQSLVLWWNSVCNQIESNINDLDAQQLLIDKILGIATNASASASAAQSAAEYATLTGLTPIPAGDILFNSAAGAAIPVGSSISAALDAVFGNARGDILFRGATGWKVLAPGTAGQTLHTGGAGADVYWA